MRINGRQFPAQKAVALGRNKKSMVPGAKPQPIDPVKSNLRVGEIAVSMIAYKPGIGRSFLKERADGRIAEVIISPAGDILEITRYDSRQAMESMQGRK